LTKGAYSVTIQTNEIQENYDNQLRVIPLPTVGQNQASGVKDTRVNDLLKITHSIVIRGILISTTERNNIIKIIKGAEVSASPVTLTYDTHPDTPLSVFINKCQIIEKAMDKQTANAKKYEIQLTVIEGTT
jgi:hypothetical protein